MNKFPYPYYFYGSQDSIDLDVLIQIPKELMPYFIEDRKRLVKKMLNEYNLPFNANLIVVDNGVIVDTIFPKTWIDSVNNSLYNTYSLHMDKQKYPLPINRTIHRNKLLSIYKTIRTILSLLSRTNYRQIVKPVLNGIHPFTSKIEALKQIDFNTITEFNQPNMSNTDIWKVIAFYLGQNISLIKDNVELYTKSDIAGTHPDLSPFIYRENIINNLKLLLNEKILYYLSDIIIPYGDFIQNDHILECKGEVINMKKEIYI